MASSALSNEALQEAYDLVVRDKKRLREGLRPFDQALTVIEEVNRALESRVLDKQIAKLRAHAETLSRMSADLDLVETEILRIDKLLRAAIRERRAVQNPGGLHHLITVCKRLDDRWNDYDGLNNGSFNAGLEEHGFLELKSRAFDRIQQHFEKMSDIFGDVDFHGIVEELEGVEEVHVGALEEAG